MGLKRRRANPLGLDAATSHDDIPMAQRSTVRPQARLVVWNRLGLAGLALLLLAGTLAAVFPGSIRRWFLPTPVAGLDARPTADGRLLGHFPYAEIKEELLVPVAPGLALHPDAAEALVAMQRAAAFDGVSLALLSAFRPKDLQQEIFFEVKAERNQSALERARVSAPPGYSEHSTGFAVDLGDGGAPQTHLTEAFEATTAFLWLQDHAARYHFTLSFPPDNPQGVSYEPWHWRFEGSAESLQVFEPAHSLAR